MCVRRVGIASPSLRAKYEAASRELAAARSMVKDLTTSNDDLMAAASAAKLEAAEAVRVADSSRAAAEKALAGEVEARQQLERDLEDYRRKLVSRGQDVLARDAELAAERRTAEARLQRVSGKLEALQRQVRSNREVLGVEDRLAAALRQVDSLTAKNSALTSELTSVSHRLEGLSADRVPGLEAELASLRNQLQHAEWSLGRARESAAASAAACDALQADNKALGQQVTDLQADLALLEVRTWGWNGVLRVGA
jgi:chromosome segregation ATPase